MPTYKFAPYKRGSKITCPQCKKPGKLRRYIDVETGSYLPDHVGVCDREESCGYKYTWWDYVRDEQKDIKLIPQKTEETKPTYYSTIPQNIFKKSLPKDKFQDELSTFLCEKFGSRAEKVLRLYKIGLAKTWGDKNCTVFWQIDINGKIRSGKIMAYERRNGDIKRVKSSDGFALINWVHSFYKKDDYQLKQCFFGEHLLKEFPNKPVCIVEGEKTAIICSVYYPEYLWLSSGMLHGINDDKMEPLKDRKIILIPDKGVKAYDTWKKKVKHYSGQGYDIGIKKIITEKLKDGDDIADLILA